MTLFGCISFILLLFSFSTEAFELPRDGALRLYHSHSDEFLAIQYEVNGQIKPDAITKINHFMRSREEGATIEVQVDLIRLLDHLQDHFDVDTVEVICGYRSEAFNKKLYTSGHNVARESYHTMGLATDIHLDEISEDQIVKYLRSLNLGGVGYYPKLLMVHADVGIKRFWQEDQFKQRTDIGIPPIIFHTDKLFYYKGEKMLLIPPPKQREGGGSYSLDHFFRGQWRTLLKRDFLGADRVKVTLNALAKGNQADLSENKSEVVLAIPYGKFRWKTLLQNGSTGYSNEFYFKKK